MKMPRSRVIAGLDVGSSKIATIVVGITEDGVRVLGITSIPSRGISKGQIVDIEEASAAIIESVEAAERMAGYHIGKAIVGVGGSHLFSQNSKGIVAVAEPNGEISPGDVSRVIEAARAVSLPSSREILHVIPREFNVDGQPGIRDPVGMSGVRLEVDTHIVTGSATAIRNLVKCVGEMGIDVQSMAAVSLAAAEAVLTPTEKELGVILVDIGGGTTNISIFVEGAPFCTACLPVGAKNVTNDLAIGLRLPLEAAEKLKIALSAAERKVVLPEEKLPEGEEKKRDLEEEVDLAKLGIETDGKKVSRKTLVDGIIKPRLHEIFTLVGGEIEKSGAIGLTPAGIVVCGGGAKVVGILEAAKRILSMPARVGAPSGISGLIDDAQSPEFAATMGLTLINSQPDGKKEESFSFAGVGKKLPRVPLKGMFSKALEAVKSLLP